MLIKCCSDQILYFVTLKIKLCWNWISFPKSFDPLWKNFFLSNSILCRKVLSHGFVYHPFSSDKAVILNLAHGYPLGYASTLQGVRGILNHFKISPQKLNKRGFGGMQKGVNFDSGVRKGVQYWFGGTQVTKGWEPLI